MYQLYIVSLFTITVLKALVRHDNLTITNQQSMYYDKCTK